MEIVGLGYHFEDLPVGRKFSSIGRTITEGDILNYVNCTGLTEVMFTDLEFLKQGSAIRGRVGPAMLAYAMCEGLLVQATMQHTALAFLHMELNIHNPIFAGDTVHVEVEITEARLSRSNPSRGLVRSRNEVKKHDGSPVLTYTPLRMVKCREVPA